MTEREINSVYFLLITISFHDFSFLNISREQLRSILNEIAGVLQTFSPEALEAHRIWYIESKRVSPDVFGKGAKLKNSYIAIAEQADKVHFALLEILEIGKRF